MSGPVRTGVVFGLATAAAVIGAQLLGVLLPIPCIGLLSVIALGLGAGYTAAKVTGANRDQRIGRGATAGAIAGVIVLLGATLGGLLVSFLPAYQAQIAAATQQLQQDPNFGGTGLDSSELTSLIGGATGILGGFCSGLFYLLLMALLGLLGSLFWKGATAGDYVAAGATGSTTPPSGAATYDAPPSGSYIPTQTNDPSTPEPGVRVYDQDDPNRSQ